jgi:hypothetical protein
MPRHSACDSIHSLLNKGDFSYEAQDIFIRSLSSSISFDLGTSRNRRHVLRSTRLL